MYVCLITVFLKIREGSGKVHFIPIINYCNRFEKNKNIVHIKLVPITLNFVKFVTNLSPSYLKRQPCTIYIQKSFNT